MIMFGNLFSVYKNNFLFLKLKNLFGNSKWTENKNYSQNLICKRNCKMLFLVFNFQKSMKIRI